MLAAPKDAIRRCHPAALELSAFPETREETIMQAKLRTPSAPKCVTCHELHAPGIFGEFAEFRSSQSSARNWAGSLRHFALLRTIRADGHLSGSCERLVNCTCLRRPRWQSQASHLQCTGLKDSGQECASWTARSQASIAIEAFSTRHPLGRRSAMARNL